MRRIQGFAAIIRIVMSVTVQTAKDRVTRPPSAILGRRRTYPTLPMSSSRAQERQHGARERHVGVRHEFERHVLSRRHIRLFCERAVRRKGYLTLSSRRGGRFP